MNYFKILLIVLIINFLLLLGNYRIFNSYYEQFFLITDINNTTYDYKENIDDVELNFPDIGVTSMNLKAIKARYLIHEEKYDRALKLLDSIKYDPLSMDSALKAEIFLFQYDLDSLYYYSKKSFEGLPLNSAHFLYYLKALTDLNKIDEAIEIYTKYEEKINDVKWVYFYFVTIYSQLEKYPVIKKQAGNALKKYKNEDDENLNTIIYYILFGEEEYKESLKTFEKANALFNQEEFLNAAENYKKARILFPLNFDYYYNEMVCYYELKDIDKIISVYNEIDYEIKLTNNGKTEFLIARAYLNQQDTINACKYFDIAKSLGFKSSISYQKNTCK